MTKEQLGLLAPFAPEEVEAGSWGRGVGCTCVGPRDQGASPTPTPTPTTTTWEESRPGWGWKWGGWEALDRSQTQGTSTPSGSAE